MLCIRTTILPRSISTGDGEPEGSQIRIGQAMESFPEFMKRGRNRVPTESQNTEDIEGYFYEAADGSQMAFWECLSDRVSRKHTNDFDEYMVCISGRYVACFADQEVTLGPGDELLIPGGTEQWGRCTRGTRTIHAFSGRRIR